MKCPICKREVAKSDPEFPFCSERCRGEDLANWIYGRYRVSVPISEPDEVPDENAADKHPEEHPEDSSDEGGE